MVTTEETPGRATAAQRWLARLALVAAAAAVLVPPVVAGFRQSVAEQRPRPEPRALTVWLLRMVPLYVRRRRPGEEVQDEA